MTDFFSPDIPSPCYVIDEKALRSNLSLIKSVKERSGVEIILAFKAFALWKTFPLLRYISYTTASSLSERVWRLKKWEQASVRRFTQKMNYK